MPGVTGFLITNNGNPPINVSPPPGASAFQVGYNTTSAKQIRDGIYRLSDFNSGAPLFVVSLNQGNIHVGNAMNPATVEIIVTVD